MRLLAAASAVALAVLAALALPLASASSIAREDVLRARALDAYGALQRDFYLPQLGLYRPTHPAPSSGTVSQVWPYSQALIATLDVAAIPGASLSTDVQARLSGLERYWDAAPPVAGYGARPGSPSSAPGPRFYDDNGWLGLALVQLYQARKEPALLARAVEVERFLESGWDGQGGGPCPGGVYWRESVRNHSRGAVSTAPASQLAAELYTITRRPALLTFAKQAYSWVDRCLRLPGGLYADSYASDGRLDRTVWSYNQGSMIAAGVMLWRATGDRTYLRQARHTARLALRYLAHAPRRELAYLEAILLDDLMQLDAAAPNPAYRAAATAWAKKAWSNARDTKTGLFRFNNRPFAQLLEQAAAVRVLAILAWNPSSNPHVLALATPG